MWLIATDEAGYGPKLGPLVIVATTWKLPTSEPDFAKAFEHLAKPVRCGEATIRIDDSKAIFRPASRNSKNAASLMPEIELPAALTPLHLVTSAVAATLEVSEKNSACSREFTDWLDRINPQDASDRAQTPWLDLQGTPPLMSPDSVRPILDHWCPTSTADEHSVARLCNVHCRVITAGRFNQICDDGKNKSDLLTQASLGLVRDAIVSADSNGKLPADIHVFCDRHGGRRYYADAIGRTLRPADQNNATHEFAPETIEIIEEASQISRYTVGDGEREIRWNFTVKGDRFAPVAMSSMIAKYIRERMMGAMNRYFADRHPGETPLKPTAGYPQDAKRFLVDIADQIRRDEIDIDRLVRQR
ncbi:ribonuclease H family protein [Crateriforma conspicua]|uniref:Uncharacterized protein n=1 Tax=Crateriforma conspicua TaxID=2527996 RepID=A0A5C5Y7F4_9PLAN|nr:hypothetical protein [Crateriforma conspicua]QDV64838.1 Hypothetical protein Mal65_40020 [Crateriforma conspicua]TWT70235.1 hypothetical protein Pan14r_25360 [Crateriforma conspicua]